MGELTRRTFVQSIGAIAVGNQTTPPATASPASTDSQAAAWPVEAGTVIVNGLDTSTLSQEYLDKTRRAGVGCWHKSLAGLRMFADAHAFVDANSTRVRVATSVREIEQAQADRVIALVFGWQYATEVDDGAASTTNDWLSSPPRTELPAYYHLGLRIAGIAYNVTTTFGGGCLEGTVPLSRAGRALVEQIHKLRIVLDVGGHTGEQTSLDAMAMSSGVPVVCTHTNVAALNDNPRATSNRVLEAIAKSGGVVGLTAINDFINRNRTMAHVAETPWRGLDTLLDQYDYLRKRLGVEHLGLGPDFTFGHSPTRDERMFPPESVDRGPRRFVKGFEDISELPNLVDGFKARGWSRADIDAVLGGNWLRVYRQVWGS
jgi:membrane dipeptidase